MSEPKPILLNLFEMATPGHITHGMWRQPGNNRERYKDLDYWVQLAQLAEEGGFDAIFLADVVGVYDVYRDTPDIAVREGLQIPNIDPLLVIPSMAAATRTLGFGVTSSTSYEPPFAFARRMSTLDHLTRGRVAWNVVTSYLPNAARNVGLDDQMPKELRYEIAEEYLHVVYKLWEGSWDDDAVRADRDGSVYTDPAKVRRIDHHGVHFRVQGPHLAEPSPQRTPVIYQATASPSGAAMAGRHAEFVFTGGPTSASVRRAVGMVRDAAVAEGRGPDAVKFVVQAAVVVGRDEAEAAEKLARYRRFSSEEGKFVHMSVPFRPLDHPGDRTVRDALLAEGRVDLVASGALPLDITCAQYVTGVDEAWQPHFFTSGTATQVVDDIERWMDEDGVDGINLRQYHSFETLTDFVELVVPELRRRRRLREKPSGSGSGSGTATLREQLTGGGARLPAEHVAARYRGGRNLGEGS